MSSTVANAMKHLVEQGTESDDNAETIKFILNFDRFFDCFNVRCAMESVYERKPDLRPYRDPCDTRLKVAQFSIWSLVLICVTVLLSG